MKITMEAGAVVCSLEEKNSNFLSACGDIFDGFQNGKLKLFIGLSKDETEVITAELNYGQVKELLRAADRYSIPVDAAVREYAERLESIYRERQARKRAREELNRQRQRYELLCAKGCGGCPDLCYDIDLPICKKTGEILKEENKPKYIGGVLRLFNLVAVPSENCPFNISNDKEYNNV